MRIPIDRFTLILLGTIGVATYFPAEGEVARMLGVAGSVAVALLFFFHGAALSREQVVAGASHWRLHIIITAMTFVVFPVLVWPISKLPSSWVPEDLVLGFLYLGVLPSAVSSSIAFTAMARGNVPAAVCSAAASNVFGMMLTPFLLLLLVSVAGDGFSVGDALKDIVFQLLLPFGVGHGLRPWLGRFMERNKPLMARYDQGVILLIVYSAFSHSVASGLWQRLPVTSIILAIGLCDLLLFVVILLARLAAMSWGLNTADEAAVVFCGSKKSLASGLPMAKVLFAGHPGFGMIVLPIMCYNQIQIIVEAVLAKWYLSKFEDLEPNSRLS
ncbi:bile acid:sodium symporter [Marinobacter nanhaiticus D15-8W]|uniref:Bile acid:sodium symporter n=1 Tax=Marinobacter nanhaiticus D15-8W TaxID=626887 RepID=N6W3Z5_9GAMM|nr:bile acid:sodium symporter family protein [Marinobacter nanhaiticus]ENO17230.1 bile acid:sodium symporter [Marinobacter nanhaiticus D15-8W]BES72096.1 bile acid:sodium symporter [Marinobacter nanhaiticus D15-8W]